MTLTHVAASTTERFEEDKTGGDDRRTGSTNLPPTNLSREEWNEEIQVKRAKKKTRNKRKERRTRRMDVEHITNKG